MLLSPQEVAEQVRLMVAGEREDFAGLFAPDGVMAYPFAPPGHPGELRGQDAIRSYFAARREARGLLRMDGVDAVIRSTDDPEVVVTQITHHGWSRALEAPYRFTALGVIRVRNGKIVRYDDYMDPIAIARLFGRTGDLVEALTAP